MVAVADPPPHPMDSITSVVVGPPTLAERLCTAVARIIEAVRCRTRCGENCCTSDCNTRDVRSPGPEGVVPVLRTVAAGAPTVGTVTTVTSV